MKQITRKTVALYCLPLFSIGLFTTMIGDYLIYFYQPTAQSGLPALITQGKVFAGVLTVIGLINAVAHVIDAVSDPLVASLSDRSRNRDGRRLPFIRRFAAPFALSALMVFCAPFTSDVLNDLWLAVWLWAFYIFYTLYDVPHCALIPEIVRDNGLLVDSYTFHSLFFVTGNMLGYAAPALVSLIKKAGVSPLAAWRMTFLGYALLGGAVLFVPLLVVKEKDYARPVQPTVSLGESLRHAFANRHFRVVTLGQLLEGTGMSFFQACTMYYITQLMGLPEENSIWIMAAAILGSLVLYPAINRWSKGVGKKKPMLVGCGVFAGAQLLVCLSGVVPAEHAMLASVLFALLLSLPFAVLNILPPTMMADVIRCDTITTGVNQEGTFAAARSFVTKLGTSLATMIVPSLIVVGAATGQGVGRRGLLLTAVVGGAFTLAAAFVYLLYDEKEIRAILRRGEETGQ